MATNLDLEEQEQLEQLKHFWRQYGSLITWSLALVLAAVAAWFGWQRYQHEQAVQAGSMFDEIERMVQASDPERAGSLFAEIRERYPRTVYTAQAGLMTAKVQLDKGKNEAALASLQWVAENAGELEYRAVARLRWAGMLMDDKKYDEALKVLGGDWPKSFEPLAADRRGDILSAQGKKADATAAYRSAYQAMDAQLDYRRLVDAKLIALGAADSASAASATAAGASR
ncbi:MAG TPA: tetratricopeptide repeat protein [Burkholderiaceae bacterium]|nr:tetratricopeptide repeat protein [Burkholderiaceae bacterium]